MPKQPQRESVPPTIPPARAIELLKKQLNEADSVVALRHGDPKIAAWKSTTISILNAAFGRPNGADDKRTYDFDYCGGGFFYVGMPEHEIQAQHVETINARKALLQAYIEQLEILAPPAAMITPDQYRFHPEIERVSGQLYRNGHYKQAALEAYIRVIDEVRCRSGLPHDGDNLMNHAFGCDNRDPVIRFNSLRSDSEKDEQRGLMLLYKGIVGLRNSKAHSNRLFDDPSRAHEYLALASCLMRLLEIAEVQLSRP